MLLAADIGNSNIVLALWDGHRWAKSVRIDTTPLLQEKEYERYLRELLDEAGGVPAVVTDSIISSVVPAVTGPVAGAMAGLFQAEPTVLNARTDTGIRLAAEHPERVGADLIADAAGAYALVEDTCIVVDLGTATTLMAIEHPGVLIGGAICAGLRVSVDSLVEKTAQLQSIPLEIPASAIGRNTEKAMQSGLVLGHLCMVEGLIDRQRDELGPAPVVATGGLVSLLASETDYFDYVEPMLTLDGLRIIAERQG